MAPHGFIIGLRRLKRIFLKRTRDFLSENINKKASTRIRGPLEAIISEKRPLANRISFKSPSTEELSTYIMASHGFIISLRRLKPTFVKRNRDFLSKNIIKKASTRIRGALYAIKLEKSHSLIGFHSKAQCEGPRSPPASLDLTG